MNNSIIILINVVVSAMTILIAYTIINKRKENAFLIKKKNIEKEIKEKERESQRQHQSAKDKLYEFEQRKRKELERETQEKRNALTQSEFRIRQKEEQLDHQQKHLEEQAIRLKELRKKEQEIINELSGKLETIAGLSQEDAKKQLLLNVERNAKNEAGKLIKTITEESKKIANKRAKEIIATAMQRSAVDIVTTQTTTIVELPSDDLKGRVIGKEGRNIRAFESCAGVDIIIDETPNSVIISCFDPIRRQTAKLALEKLVEDGRIHPSRIEECLQEAKKEIEQFTFDAGEKALESLGIQLHPKITEILGRLYFRYSYGQNMLHHAVECAQIAALMAEELGVNVNLAKKGALLHDVGKGLDFEIGGSHDEIGRDLCRKYGESEEIQNCIMAHHEQEEPQTIEALIVIIADSVSSARPGARRESTESYIKRLTKLENIASNYDCVEKAYAIQAGRELRIFVKPDKITDNETQKLAFDVAQKIEKNVDFPGQIKVSIIRETRMSSIAG